MENMEQLRKLISKKRRDKNLVREKVSELLKIEGIEYAESSLTRFENGKIKNIRIEILNALCDILDIDKKEAFSLAGLDNKTILNEFSNEEDFIRVPLYRFTSAGKGYINFDEVVNKIVLPRLINKVDKNSFCVAVKGVLMIPYYNDGDIIVINPDYCAEIELLNEKECVIDYNGERSLKRLLFNNGDLILKSFNEAYKDIMVPNEKLNEVSCCGVVTMVLDMRV